MTQKMSSRRARRLVVRGLGLAGGGAGTWLLLLLAATLALELPAVVSFTGLPSASAVFYDAGRGLRFTALSDRFIHAILGLTRQNAAVAKSSAPAAGASARAGVAGQPPTAERGVVISHPFTNDNFDNAYPVPALPFSGHTDMSHATREPGEPGDCSQVGGTAWYRYAATSPSVLRLVVLSGSPTALQAYTGNSIGSLTPAGACSKGSTRNAATSLMASVGTTYYFQVTAVTQGGPITFQLFAPGPNQLVSMSQAGTPGNDTGGGFFNQGMALSRDGAVVAFQSNATNLDPAHPLGPCNPDADVVLIENPVTCSQVYVRDRGRGTTELVSRSTTTGASADAPALEPEISADGRYVAFASAATDLVIGDTNTAADIFVFDRATSILTRESLAPGGAEITEIPGNAGSFSPAISPDGRYVAFTSDGRNLPGNDTCNPAIYNCIAGFVRDRLTGAVTEVTVDPQGQPVNDDQPYVRGVSTGGHYVIFESPSAEILPSAQATCKVQSNPNGLGAQGGGCVQVYRRDMLAGKTILGSVSSVGVPGNQTAFIYTASMSADGRYGSFDSLADNLVPNDTNACVDTFRHDFVTGRTIRVSVDSTGAQVTDTNETSAAAAANGTASTGGKRYTSISDDGNLVLFDSAAPELDPAANPSAPDAYAHDVATGETVVIGVSPSGSNKIPSYAPVVSPDGSEAAIIGAGLSASDDSGVAQVYIHAMTELR
ncbi:MAG: TolB family protein [Candidatus Dormibacteria bacterium]